MMEDLSFHVLDLAENAVNAGATRIIILINENAAHDVLTIRVADNGRGMPAGGTRVAARFRYRHIDRQPLTKMTETMMMLLLGRPEIDFHDRHRRNGRFFSFVSHEFFLRSGRASSGTAVLCGAVRRALRSGLRRIGAS